MSRDDLDWADELALAVTADGPHLVTVREAEGLFVFHGLTDAEILHLGQRLGPVKDTAESGRCAS